MSGTNSWEKRTSLWIGGGGGIKGNGDPKFEKTGCRPACRLKGGERGAKKNGSRNLIDSARREQPEKRKEGGERVMELAWRHAKIAPYVLRRQGVAKISEGEKNRREMVRIDINPAGRQGV